MALNNNRKLSRRKFVKGAAGATVCCSCFSFIGLAAIEQNSEGKEHLAAACGTYCGACPAYIAKHSEDEQIKIKRQKSSSSEPTKIVKGTPPRIGWMDFFAMVASAAENLLPIAKTVL